MDTDLESTRRETYASANLSTKNPRQTNTEMECGRPKREDVELMVVTNYLTD